MIDNKIREILARRMTLHPEDALGTEECWKDEIAIMSRDVEQTIDFLRNRCTGEEFAWLSEVFEEVQAATHSEELRECLYAVAEKYPDITKEYNILSFIDSGEEKES